MPAPAERSPRSTPRAISWRSVGLGILGVIAINALTPYNDYALNNTPMVGNNLPVGVVLLMFCLVVFINAPLSRWRPRWALSSGEMTVTLSMALVGCAIPSAGLLRYLPPMLVTPFSIAGQNIEAAAVVEGADVPAWLLPEFSGATPREWMQDPLVSGYLARWPEPNVWTAILAWVRPALTWAIFLAALYAALLAIVVLVRRQWVENERLAFPLAQVGLALVEQPAPGRFFNAVLAKRSFWIAFFAVFAMHLNNGLASYLPGYIPAIPRGYQLAGLFADAPWTYMRWEAKVATIYFIVIGATYFIPSSIAFSLWFFFALEQVWAMSAVTVTGEPHLTGTLDQHVGAIVAFAIAIAWVGRHHWAMILRQSFRGRREGEPTDPYLPYPVAFWLLVASAAIMIGWMIAAGVTVLASVVAVISLLILFVVITRIVAESGIIHGMLVAHLTRPWELLSYYGAGKLIPLKSMYITGLVDGALFDYREVASVYASHAVKVSDETIAPRPRSGAWKLIALMGLALAIAYVVGFTSTLWTEYTYAATADTAAISPINTWASSVAPQWWVLDPALRYTQDTLTSPHDPLTHIGIGFVITAALSAMRLTFAWWPLHPVGYLMLGTFPGNQLWFSFLLGWIVKVLLVRFGGSKLYTQAKPFFLGLIVGESVAAGFWMVIGIVLNLLGAEYRPIMIMPI